MGKDIQPIPGEAAARYFLRVGKLSAASRLGIQRKAGKGWESVSMFYRVKAGDRIRIRGAVGGSRHAGGLKTLVRKIVLQQKGRKK
jgi:hypothetical protein